MAVPNCTVMSPSPKVEGAWFIFIANKKQRKRGLWFVGPLEYIYEHEHGTWHWAHAHAATRHMPIPHAAVYPTPKSPRPPTAVACRMYHDSAHNDIEAAGP